VSIDLTSMLIEDLRFETFKTGRIIGRYIQSVVI